VAHLENLSRGERANAGGEKTLFNAGAPPGNATLSGWPPAGFLRRTFDEMRPESAGKWTPPQRLKVAYNVHASPESHSFRLASTADSPSWQSPALECRSTLLLGCKHDGTSAAILECTWRGMPLCCAHYEALNHRRRRTCRLDCENQLG